MKIGIFLLFVAILANVDQVHGDMLKDIGSCIKKNTDDNTSEEDYKTAIRNCMTQQLIDDFSNNKNDPNEVKDEFYKIVDECEYSPFLKSMLETFLKSMVKETNDYRTDNTDEEEYLETLGETAESAVKKIPDECLVEVAKKATSGG